MTLHEETGTSGEQSFGGSFSTKFEGGFAFRFEDKVVVAIRGGTGGGTFFWCNSSPLKLDNCCVSIGVSFGLVLSDT